MSKSPEICLAIDTALEACSTALIIRKEGEIKSLGNHLDLQRGHAEVLMAEIGKLLDQAGLTYKDLTRLATTIGPGSFTGLRIGLSTARALALALDIPCIGASTLKALALTARVRQADKEDEQGPLACLVDARRGEIYTQLFPAQKAGSDEIESDSHQGFDLKPIARTVSDISSLLKKVHEEAKQKGQNLTLIGSACPLVLAEEKVLESCPVLTPACPDMQDLAIWALDQKRPDGPPSPLYLRAPDAKPQALKAIERRTD